MTQISHKPKTFFDVPGLSQRHPAFSKSALRHLIFDANKNGFQSVIFRVGKKILLEETAFEQWVLRQQNKGGQQ